MKTTATPKEYAESFSRLLKSGEATIKWLDQANHIALEMELITLDHFQAAARVLAKEFLKG